MPDRPIPLQAPWYDEDEEQAALAALRRVTGAGAGPIGLEVEAELARRLGVRHVLLTTSATHALEMAMLALDLGPGDEVILPSFTFASCANAIALRGARPVFADVTPDTMTIDPQDIRRKASAHTRAIMPMHYAGGSADMGPILDFARERGYRVIEDAAHAFGATHQGRAVGTAGDVGCYSFHATKNLSCGEGGAFVSDDDELSRRAEIIREKGTNRSAFLRGEIDRYTWVKTGSSYVLADLLAALLQAQLRKADRIRQLRQERWNIYQAALQPLAARGRLTLPRYLPGGEPNYHIFYFHTETAEGRGQLLAALRAQSIGATFHYVPLHTAPEGRRLAGEVVSLPVTERLSETLVRLPLYPQLPLDACHRVADAVVAFLDGRRSDTTRAA
jgi:dTDP-4-amino-4,6-dideoxygalactose transaminase